MPEVRVIELGSADAPLLQQFFDANPEYFQLTQGTPASANEAKEELHGELPAGWPYTKTWFIGSMDSNGALMAFANLVSDLLAPGVWNVSTFIVATARHGTGDARRLHESLEAWAYAKGAKWLRLGVVQGNTRAERFWQSQGYVQTRLREGVQFGSQTNTLRVMFKPLAGGTMAEYHALVPRDCPESSQAG
ncbi:hypothetical protein AT984_08185 [Paucibacter sp. KCTC 42545]|nr:hypothetical protein AT984_08185 [Paucibacter sp. KCTC 42545]